MPIVTGILVRPMITELSFETQIKKAFWFGAGSVESSCQRKSGWSAGIGLLACDA